MNSNNQKQPPKFKISAIIIIIFSLSMGIYCLYKALDAFGVI